MGGMIAQTLAVRHPRMVRSLVSIMSSTGSLRSGSPALRMYPLLLRRAPSDRAHTCATPNGSSRRSAHRTSPATWTTCSAGGEELRTRSRPRRTRPPARRDHRLGRPHRGAAAGEGADPRDPRHRRSARHALGGRATARAISGARLMTVPGMGHDLPRVLWPQLIDAIAGHAHAADAALAHSNGAPPLQALPSSLPGLQG